MSVKEKPIHMVLEQFPREERFSLAILQEIQREYGYIASDHLKAAADYLSIPISQVFSMATFYKALSLDKKGKLILKVCDGTACHIRGSKSVLDEIKRTLQIGVGQTTEDGLFSLEVVNCVGSCAIAPVVVCGDAFFGNTTPERCGEIIEACKQTEDSAGKEAD